ncbi:MAG: hypothetical protein GDA49_02140 [Rhodospirillales bacterium]|nr:hypothetical protein [Rhodospirillales bacterium]
MSKKTITESVTAADGSDWTEKAFWQGASLSDVERRIDAGDDVNARNKDGETPLHWAAGGGKTRRANHH